MSPKGVCAVRVLESFMRWVFIVEMWQKKQKKNAKNDSKKTIQVPVRSLERRERERGAKEGGGGIKGAMECCVGGCIRFFSLP